MGWGRVRTTATAAVLGAVFVALGVFLARQGLDGADKWASVISMLAGLAGLVVAVLSLRRGRAGDGGSGLRASVGTGDVSGEVTGVRGIPATDLSVDVKTGHVRPGGSVTGLDLTGGGVTPPPAPPPPSPRSSSPDPRPAAPDPADD
ncbi:MAG TPA: hypothetical protein VGD67_07330 [Pseudonocardiaceae bacterium]